MKMRRLTAEEAADTKRFRPESDSPSGTYLLGYLLSDSYPSPYRVEQKLSGTSDAAKAQAQEKLDATLQHFIDNPPPLPSSHY